MIKKPQVSIIIPTYNRKSLLMETLQSVKNQTLEEWECIVVDDGGNDGTAKELLKLRKTDSRFQYFKRPPEYPKGTCGCRNFGFSQSSGKYIQWLDDDDLLSKNKLEEQVAELNKKENPAIFATCSWDFFWPEKKLKLKNTFSRTGKLTKENYYSLLANQQSFVPSLAFLTNRKLCLNAGEWNTDLKMNQDAEYFNRVLVHSEELIHVPGCHVLYREHSEDRLSRQRSVKHIKSFFLSMQLMQAYLKMYNIDAKAYFRWKLLKWFLAYRKTYPELIKKYHFLFMESGINPTLANYYSLKHNIYKKVYPWYKKKFKN